MHLNGVCRTPGWDCDGDPAPLAIFADEDCAGQQESEVHLESSENKGDLCRVT